MAEYIKLDEALDAVSWDTEAYTAINMLDTMEIIHCKDCIYYPSEYTDCPLIGWPRNGDDFCSYAERREDA